jgi:two-component system cell cycle response regulator DivK
MNAAAAKDAAAGAAMLNRRILIVEDHEDSRRILCDLLASRGYDLVEAEDGEQALAMAEERRPALILMDVQIPLLDGYEVTRRIKANPALRAIPVIAVTSYALSGDESRARAAGCNAYVSKPYSARKLLAKIEEYVP